MGISSSPACVIDALEYGNETRFINCQRGTGKEPNCKFDAVEQKFSGQLTVVVQLIADVEVGDEFLVDYGDTYWNGIQIESDDDEEEFIGE